MFAQVTSLHRPCSLCAVCCGPGAPVTCSLKPSDRPWPLCPTPFPHHPFSLPSQSNFLLLFPLFTFLTFTNKQLLAWTSHLLKAVTLIVLKNQSKRKLPLRIYIFTSPWRYFISKKSCLGKGKQRKEKKRKSKGVNIRQHSVLTNNPHLEIIFLWDDRKNIHVRCTKVILCLKSWIERWGGLQREREERELSPQSSTALTGSHWVCLYALPWSPVCPGEMKFLLFRNGRNHWISSFLSQLKVLAF